MKKILFLGWIIWSGAGLLKAQPSIKRPDLIIRKDDAVIEATIVGSDNRMVHYYFFSSPSSGIKALPWKAIKKITYANGREESGPSKTTAIQEIKLLGAEPIKHEPREQQLSPEQLDAFEKGFVFSIGPEALYILGGRGWTQVEGEMGFRQGVGGGMEVGYRGTSFFAISFRSGLQSWAVKRDYQVRNETQYTDKSSFAQVPFLLGASVYPVKKFYLRAEGGGQWTLFTNKNIDTTKRVSILIPRYGGRVGYELLSGRIPLDISVEFYVSVLKNARTRLLSQQGNINGVALRLSVGLKTLNR